MGKRRNKMKDEERKGYESLEKENKNNEKRRRKRN
jgi:hypothetical protein